MPTPDLQMIIYFCSLCMCGVCFYVFIIYMVIIHSNFFKNNIKQCKVFFFVSLNTFRGVGVCQYDSELIQQMSQQKQTPKNMPEHQRAR